MSVWYCSTSGNLALKYYAESCGRDFYFEASTPEEAARLFAEDFNSDDHGGIVCTKGSLSVFVVDDRVDGPCLRKFIVEYAVSTTYKVREVT